MSSKKASKAVAAPPAAKRKDPESASLDMLGAEEAAPAPKSLKSAFLAQYKAPIVPTRTIRTGGSATPSVTVTGIVTKTGFNQDKTKLQCVIEVHKVRHNNAPDVVLSGHDGFAWLLPSFQPKSGQAARDAADDGPESGAASKSKKDKKDPAPPRSLVLDNSSHKTVGLWALPRAEFWMSGAGKGETKAGMDLVKPGMPVEVTGVVARIADDHQHLWLNTAGITPLLDGQQIHQAAEVMVNFLSKHDVLEQQAVRLSLSMRGFFGASYDEPHLEEQAGAFRSKWSAIKSGTVGACEAKAMAIRSELGTDGEQAAVVMDTHAERIRGLNPADLAFGQPFFAPHTQPSPDRPLYTASLVHELESMAYPANKLANALLDGNTDGLPQMFAVPECRDIELNSTNSLMMVKYALKFVGDTTKALAAVRSNKNPIIDSLPTAAIGVKYLTRDFVSCTGVVAETKALRISEALVRYGKYCFTAGVTPREIGDDGVPTPFVGSFAFDMLPTLRNISVKVDEAFVKEHLADGNSQYVYEHDPTLPTLKDKEGTAITAGAGPQLRSHHYQEISGNSFKFASATLPDGKTDKEYRIWWEDAPNAIMDALGGMGEVSDPLEDEEAGKKLAMEAAAALSLDLPTFLLQRCATYCIAI